MRLKLIKSRSHRPRQAVEVLESRGLLSTGYQYSPVSFFNFENNGAVQDIITDKAGDLFGTQLGTVQYGNGTIFEIPAGSQNPTTLFDFNGTAYRFPEDLTMDANGNFYAIGVPPAESTETKLLKSLPQLTV